MAHFFAYRQIDFVDDVITPSSDGRVVFVEARGDFVTLDGRPYRNVYLIKLVFDDAGAVTRIEEWTNPVTAALTWEFPLSELPRHPSSRLARQAPARKRLRVLPAVESVWSSRRRSALPPSSM